MRTVKIDLIKRWTEQNAPLGMEKLAVKSELSISTIGLAQRGIVPAKSFTRRQIAEAIGVTEDALFPLKQQGKGSKAS